RMKIDFRSCVKISPEFADWLEVILEPMWEDRFQSATEALNVLSNKSKMIYNDYSLVESTDQKPEGSEVTLKKTSTSLIINIPSGSSTIIKFHVAIFFFLFGVAMFIIFASIIENNDMSLFSISIVLCNMLITLLNIQIQSSLKADIQIYQDEFLVSWKKLVFNRKIRGKVEDTTKLKKGIRSVYSLLSKREQRWLNAEINDFIEQLKIEKSLKKTEEKLLNNQNLTE
ncbi:MAG: hypothetical protein QNJ74_23775, partial [Trichodesmium sp. MO_231.B1]|nr:hypothetical protein [Trichodesmium sp. MO_231.B1]